MKKIAFIFSCLSIVMGLFIFVTTYILNEIMPKLGLAAFQAAATGSYSPNNYKMNFTGTNYIAVIMIIIGFIISVKLYMGSGDK